MSTEQQYRVIGKSGPGVEPKAYMVCRDGGVIKVIAYDNRWELWCMSGAAGQRCAVVREGRAIFKRDWDAGRIDILEAISPPQAGKCGRPLMPASHVGVPCGRPSGHAPVSGLCEPPPQAAVATCESWCGLPFGDKRVPPASDHPSMVVDSHEIAALCVQNLFVSNCPHPAYCTPACLDRAKSAKAPECIRSTCKAPPVAGGELCLAHAYQVEAAKRGRTKCCAWQVNGGSACGRPADVAPFCRTHHDEAVVELHRGYIAASREKPAETRLERWRREHKGYSHGAADPRIHDANVAAMMVGRDGPREPYVPPPKLPAWTPRDLDGDIPDAWERGGTRLGGTR